MGNQTTTVTAPHFKFNYPNDWMVTGEGNMFNGYTTMVSPMSGEIARVSVGEIPNDRSTDEALIETLDTLLETAANKIGRESTPFESGTDIYIVNNQTAPYVIHTETCAYSICDRIVKMETVVKIDGQHHALFEYAAEEDIFDKYLSQAEAILKTVTPIK